MAKKADDINKRKRTVTNRYGLIVFALFALFVGVVVFIFQIKYVEGNQWRELGKQETVKKDRVILPTRGNIYADDGRVLATSEPLYVVRMDFMSEGIREDSLMKYVSGLSTSLAQKFPDRSAAQYKKIIMDGWFLSRKELRDIEKNKQLQNPKKLKIKSRSIRIINRDINYLELKELKTFPFFNQRSNRSGLAVEEKTARKRPFGSLANRTIGGLYKDISMGGTSGVELKYDSLLRGVQGIKSRQKIQGQWMDVIEVPAKDGIDVQTTLDVNIQDITEKALAAKLIEIDAESGCAVIMEVATGEIKGISNLDRVSTGVYREGNPNVFSYMSEPGSTFKTASIMVALEDGVVTPTDSFYVGTGLYQYKGKWIRDHYWNQGRDRGFLTVQEGMEVSSNIVVARSILKGYENNPERYVEKLYALGLTKKIDWDVPLKGKEGTSVIRHPKDKANPWSKTTLAWMSFGYETQVPPIYMLMFYNGIANNGTMVKPFITKSFIEDGKVIDQFETEVITQSMCSERTLKEIKNMLVGVVNKGTGKVIGTPTFQIAGKTGTAQIASGGGYSGHYVSFCGYFPADNPLYTCFVAVRKPKGIPSGGGMPGMVFKNIAEEVYAQKVRVNPSVIALDSTFVMQKEPNVKTGRAKYLQAVLTGLNLKYVSAPSAVEWVHSEWNNGSFVLRQTPTRRGVVPNVLGMGARDAVYLLENSGLKVHLQGAGRVVGQSIPADSKMIQNSVITIQLR